MFSKLKAFIVLVIFGICSLSAQSEEPVEGRYVRYGNPLSTAMEIAEIEIFFNGKNVTYVPSIVAAGTEVSLISYGFFFKKAAKPAITDVPNDLKSGLNYDYMEGRWFKLTFADARAKDLERQNIDLAMHYPYVKTIWKGLTPTLEMSGPGFKRSSYSEFLVF